METNIKRWLKEDGKIFLKEIGIKKGQVILDFGCGAGHYTIPAAKIVGNQGKVYAVDKEDEVLDELMQTTQKESLENIKPIRIKGEVGISELKSVCCDAALLYDIIHLVSDRKKLYREIYRILKAGGFLSIYPKHYQLDSPGWGLKDMSLEDIIEEVEKANFHFEIKFFKRLMHDDTFDKGYILNFRKK
jgi:ubiquinone/menaquinone biosynthesis C-methylase UbiE